MRVGILEIPLGNEFLLGFCTTSVIILVLINESIRHYERSIILLRVKCVCAAEFERALSIERFLET